MTYRFNSLEELTEHFRALPGIGGKSAQRLASHALGLPAEEAAEFAEAILDAHHLRGGRPPGCGRY